MTSFSENVKYVNENCKIMIHLTTSRTHPWKSVKFYGPPGIYIMYLW